MDISLAWLNAYLETSVGAEEADEALTHAGFPIEETRDLGSDTFLDVEITSNRGDCLSHLGLAREIAASTENRLRRPEFTLPPSEGTSSLTLVNDEPDVCPRFTAQVIRGVKVGPSPDWLVERLEAVGQRSINNVVDVTNFLTLEYGQPAHVFDLDRLEGSTLRIRYASKGEHLTTLDGKARTLEATDLVVADAARAQSLAGVIGGADSEVTGETTNVVLEVACWDPVTIRTAARRLDIRTDAGYRFERGVHPMALETPARRAAALILELAGGTLEGEMLVEGAPDPDPVVVELRPSRVSRLMGVEVEVGLMIGILRDLEIDVAQEDGDRLRCTIPPHRLDLTREIDLVEEVIRVRGLGAVPVVDRLPVLVRSPQDSERASREVARVLTGHGFYETVTYSFASADGARGFLLEGHEPILIDPDRRSADPALRPSILSSLLVCRKANQDAQAPQGVRLYETASVFSQEGGRSAERRSLAMLMDAPKDVQSGVRHMRSVIDDLVRAMGGQGVATTVEATTPPAPSWSPDCARIESDGSTIGIFGLLDDGVLKAHDLAHPVVAADLDLDVLIAMYPPRANVSLLPEFPAIERDLSFVLPGATPWADVEALIHQVRPERLESVSFVETYRGKPLKSDEKSLTVRLRFRDPSRTLRREEVEPEVARVVGKAESDLGATLRS